MTDTLFFNGNILVMEEDLYAEALLIRNGRIFAYGDYKELYNLARDNTLLVDLKKNTLMSSVINFDSDLNSIINLPADLVILNKDPMKSSIEELKSLKILEMIENGVTIFKDNIN